MMCELDILLSCALVDTDQIRVLCENLVRKPTRITLYVSSFLFVAFYSVAVEAALFVCRINFLCAKEI